ncbi:MAG TPA: hypothetical protein PLF54_09075 [Deltaproteobacteria bacterium]|jgi:hypothetical protein|nr:hypothetical protein [Deltaproteobacteria bacterium]
MPLDAVNPDEKAESKRHRPFPASGLVGLAVVLILLPFFSSVSRFGKSFCGAVLSSLAMSAAAFFRPGLASELFSLSVMVVFLMTIGFSLACTRQEAP